jgi:DNA-binding transcriptional ArsR family regulator
MSVSRTPKSLNIRVRDNRRVEFFMLPNDLIDIHAAQLDSPSAVLVYAALCRYAGSNTDTQIAYTTLAAKLSLSRTTLSKALGLLEQRGYITVDRSYGQKGAEINIYTVERLPVSPENELTAESGNWTDPSPETELTLVQKLDGIKDGEDKDIKDKEMWRQLALLGIPDRRSYIRLIGRAPYDDPAATLEFARRQLAEKKRRA